MGCIRVSAKTIKTRNYILNPTFLTFMTVVIAIFTMLVLNFIWAVRILKAIRSKNV